nr:hypothetical protein DOP62_11565 [Synechococcus elongatus PCC 11801]
MAVSFPKYPAYRKADHEWLREIPSDWHEVRLKNLLAKKITDGPHTTPEFVEEGVPFLSVDGIQEGELVFSGCRYISHTAHEEYSKKAKPQKDDILMGKAASTGKIARIKTDLEFSIWSPLALIRVSSDHITPAFCEYCLKSIESQHQIELLCTSNTQKNISMDDIPKIKLALPPLSDQHDIVCFLDRETKKIDALIAEQQRLIELLQEKRQAVISHAVTKGLNSDAPMKDSGVEWLGQVPAHWSVKPLKRCASRVVVGIAEAATHAYCDEGIPILRSTNIRAGKIQGEILYVDPEYASERESKKNSSR